MEVESRCIQGMLYKYRQHDFLFTELLQGDKGKIGIKDKFGT
jgi:hypothetical protein